MGYVLVVIVLALLQFLLFGIAVGRARARYGVRVPATSGHEIFERYFRVHANTLEQLIVFLPAIWLFAQGETGWAIFMLVWGFFLISGVDNVVRPMLISRGSSLPFLLTLLGVLGGVIAFGFVGMFIGPTLLAVGYSLMSGWTHTKDPIVRQNGDGV